jgi:hypothetical protein
MKTAVLIDFAKAYFRVSPTGRRWLRSRLREKESLSKRGRIALLDDKPSRRDMIHKALICDRAFRKHVPNDLLRRMGRESRLVYGRFVPFAFINLLIRCRLLEAYGIAYDRAAETRLTVLVYLMREWNDLREIHGADAVFDAVMPKSEPAPSFFLLRRIFDDTHRIAAENECPTYVAFRRAWLERRPGFGPPEPSETRLQAAAAFSLMIGYAIMLPEVPERLASAVRPLGHWLYGLDELLDLHRDKAAHKITYFGTLADPVKEIWRLYAICEERFRKDACAPEHILSLMKFLTEEAVNAVRMGFEIESELFGAPAAGGVNRTADPSVSETATRT